MSRCAFVDPATEYRYVWAFNPDTVEQAAATRQVTKIEPVAAGWGDEVHPTRQQGAKGPESLRIAGTIGNAAQHEAFVRFERLSATQSVVFEHFTGDRLEVIVVTYEATRRAAVRGPDGDKSARTYRLELEILNQL